MTILLYGVQFGKERREGRGNAIEHGGLSQRSGDSDAAARIALAAPELYPFAGRKPQCTGIGTGLNHWGHQHVRAEKVAVQLLIPGLRCVWIGQKERAHHGQGAFRVLAYAECKVGEQRVVQPGKPRGGCDDPLAVVELHIGIRTVALVSADDRCKAGKFQPAQQQFLIPVEMEERGVAARIAGVQAVARHAERQRRSDDGGETVHPR